MKGIGIPKVSVISIAKSETKFERLRKALERRRFVKRMYVDLYSFSEYKVYNQRTKKNIGYS